jgi:hypothetical protein
MAQLIEEAGRRGQAEMVERARLKPDTTPPKRRNEGLEPTIAVEPSRWGVGVFTPSLYCRDLEPMPLASLHTPFDHPDWIFELKYDGFRALAYIDSGQCWLVSRRGTAYGSVPKLSAAIGAAIAAPTVLDGEIVHLDAEGKPQFY